MAQGTTKLNSKARDDRKGKSRPKKQNPKKGLRYVAPKKARHVQADKLKKGLEKAIKTNIESEIMQKVHSIEPKKFKIMKLSDTDSSPSTSVQDKKKK